MRKPDQVLKCPQVREKITERVRLIQRIEGKASVSNKEGSLTLLMTLRADKQFWVEMRAALGGAFAYLRSDLEWVELFIPRKKTIYRLPVSEFWHDSERRRQFLKLLPFDIVPELVYPFLMGRPLQSPSERLSCYYSPEKQTYVFGADNSVRTSYDPVAFFPTQSILNSRVYASWSLEALVEVETFTFPKDLSFSEDRGGRKRPLFDFSWEDLVWNEVLGKEIPPFSRSHTLKLLDY